MDRKKMVIAVISASLALLAAACVTASSQTKNTPLYTVRMEQASSKMNYLPTVMNSFTYTAEKGYELDYDVLGCCDAKLFDVPTASTCEGGTCGEETCLYTCWETCSTCYGTCPVTCPNTCENTCEGLTCEGTCYPDTCPWTEWIDCVNTQVFPTCYWYTCWYSTCDGC